jgi:serine/threonine protein kinase
MILGKYEILKRLGKGAFGEVVLVEDKDKKKYAVKMIPFKSFSGDNAYLLEYLESEINCLKSLRSEYVMKLYKTDEDDKNKYMIC